MKMVSEVVVFQVNHYDMGDNKGVSARILGNQENTNNKFGLAVSEASITDYKELQYLRQFADSLPAKFKTEIGFVTKKATNGKEITTVSLSNLQFLNSVEIVDAKVPAVAK